MVLLVDDLGTVLAAQPAERNWLGRRQADQPLVAAMLATPEGTITTEGPDGTRRIFGFVRLSDTATRLAVGLEEADVLRGLHREIESAYLNLAFLCVLVLFGIWFGGDRLIVRPVRSLARTAARFGQGNLTERASHTAWAAEFAPLAAALDEMAQRLAEREEELHVANTHLEELASQDGLSGLANRRGFDAGLRTEWQRAAQLHRPVGLLMIDIDHFKLFNDRYGHVDGDACLYRVGEVIGIVAAHGGYLAARYGGEEFAVLLPGCDAVSAGAAAERVRQDVATLAIEHAAATLGYVTVSVGVAMLRPGAGQSPQVLVEAADAALYAAKRQGRNLVVAHENAPVSLAS